jgi:pimeloyl-ACP methyl ester carboxylesterase
MITTLILLFLMFLGLGFFGLIIATHTFVFMYLYVEYNLGTIYDHESFPVIPIKRYFKDYWLELYYLLGKYYLLPLKWVSLSVTKNRTSDVAILLVHGYCRNQSDWLWMRKKFNNINCPIFTVNLQPNLSSIENIANGSLPQKIAAIQQQTNCKKIILIGHSMGGLVASYYSEFLDPEKLITAVITIASPLYGTKISVSAQGDNAKEMCPESEFLLALRKRMHQSSHKYYQIGSKFDNIVFPWRSAFFEHATAQQQLLIPATTHLALLHSTVVAQQLNNWVKDICE